MKASDWRPIKNLRDIKHGPGKASVVDANAIIRNMVTGWNWHPVAKPKPRKE